MAANDNENLENMPESEVIGAEAVQTEPIKAEPLEEELNAAPAPEEEVVENPFANMTKDQVDSLMQLIQSTAFYAHGYKAASKKEYKDMMKSEHVITESKDSPINNEAAFLREDLDQLNASAQAGRILEGTVVGVEWSNNDNTTSTPLVEIAYGHETVKVKIPAFCFFNYDLDNEKYRTNQEPVKRTCEDYMWAKVKFIVRQVDVAKKLAMADRLAALDREGYANYIRTTQTGKPRVTVGSVVQARVTRVSKKSVTLNALGSESSLSTAKGESNEISWTYIGDCREVFKVNQLVNVRVLALKIEEVSKHDVNHYTIVRTKLSIKQTTTNPMDMYFDEIEEKGIYAAVVTNKIVNSYFVKLKGKLDCIVAIPREGELPEIGDERIVEVTEKRFNPETGEKKVFGVFKRL